MNAETRDAVRKSWPFGKGVKCARSCLIREKHAGYCEGKHYCESKMLKNVRKMR